ncbi:MAG: hypothetical protein E5Y67_12310 [Mesorhizobium sp.]|uniref:glycoside hydrolase family 19 protein n=1 Tax=Mesorhizobium sp. TaxID=1871066 RepID=UPI0011FFB8D4|nr:glycoside hydrolase family 19 protein [Mesorhizobium sp.]TIM14456.1 MAG: hypothetical protein E5Y67_12310 [Mesorhizobium sp.]
MDLKRGDTRLIIDACKAKGVLRNQCAYVLATAYHETAHTMKPIAEMGSQQYLRSKPYWPFIGRGYVQITWEANYKKAGGKLGRDFVKNPDLLLQAKYAAPILVIGMIEGWFAGDKRGRHTLGRHITLSKSDFIGARRIINGTDKAALIASYAQKYDDLLLLQGYGVAAGKPTPKPASAPAAGLLAAFLNLLKRLFGKGTEQ